LPWSGGWAEGSLGQEDRRIAGPYAILFAAELPKTHSGKIMRRLLRDIADGRMLGDTTTLADPTVVAKLKVKGTVRGRVTDQRQRLKVKNEHKQKFCL
jgi:hypothetical protein